MNKLAAGFIAACAVLAAAVWPRKSQGQGAEPAPEQPTGGGLVDTLQHAFDGITEEQLPPQAPGRDAANLAACLAMIRAAEGTAKEGGYGALFGWPRSGRSFDPYSITDHPKQFFDYTDQAGKTVKTSAAGAYQITHTTWKTYSLAFKAWAALNGYSTSGFTPATQDAFAIFLIWRDGALDDVRNGRIDKAMGTMAKRWASLPGYSADNNPERSLAFVKSQYTNAGGTWA